MVAPGTAGRDRVAAVATKHLPDQVQQVRRGDSTGVATPTWDSSELSPSPSLPTIEGRALAVAQSDVESLPT